MSARSVREVFNKELDYMECSSVRNFVIDVFDAICPDYFWEIPASQREHHPKVCQGFGGLVKHTKLAVKFGLSFMETWVDTAEAAHDEVIAALLLHDMFKRGACENENQTFGSHEAARARHGIYCAMRIQWLWDDNPDLGELIAVDRAKRIIEAVKYHMGRWTAGYTEGEHPQQFGLGHVICTTTQLADYTASRKFDKWLEEMEV